MNGEVWVRVRSVPNRARGASALEHPHRLGLALHAAGLQLLVVEHRAVASYVARPTATPISGATTCSRDAVLIASPVRNPSPDPGSRRAAPAPHRC